MLTYVRYKSRVEKPNKNKNKKYMYYTAHRHELFFYFNKLKLP